MLLFVLKAWNVLIGNSQKSECEFAYIKREQMLQLENHNRLMRILQNHVQRF